MNNAKSIVYYNEEPVVQIRKNGSCVRCLISLENNRAAFAWQPSKKAKGKTNQKIGRDKHRG